MHLKAPISIIFFGSIALAILQYYYLITHALNFHLIAHNMPIIVKIFIVIFSKRVPNRSMIADKLYYTVKEAIAIMNGHIHVLTSVVVELRESAVKDQRYIAGVESQSSSEISDGGHGRRYSGRKNGKIHGIFAFPEIEILHVT